jgi:DNA replication and repair protein RecF
MWVSQLAIEGLRCFRSACLRPCAGLNVLVGVNGAGKTTILEALALLGSGRSFRGGARAPLIRSGFDTFSVFAHIESKRGVQNVGFSRTGSSWQAKVNGNALSSLGQLVRELPILVLEPGSHSLIEGPSESRRRLFDWLLFHVEPGFAAAVSRYQRALQQRNGALKQEGLEPRSLAVWNQQLAETGTAVSSFREQHWQLLLPLMCSALTQLLPELGEVSLSFNRGWSADQSLLADIEQRERVDIARGFSSRGPHRADWQLSFERAVERQWLSRGQEKNAYLAYAMAMLQRFHQCVGESAVLALDDIWSELDETHQERCFALAFDSAQQVWVSGTEHRSTSAAWPGERQVFHVEQGVISAV